MKPAAPTVPGTPSRSLLTQLRAELMRQPPFSLMGADDVDAFLSTSTQAYFAPGEVLLSPQQGVVQQLHYLRQGHVSGRHGLAETAGGFQFDVGDIFPVGALLGGRAVTATYTASEDVFCLLVPLATVQALAARSAPFADHLNRRVAQLLELSRRALQSAYASQSLAEQSMETALGALARKQPLAVPPLTPLSEALTLMHQRRVGSVLVVDEEQRPLGILTRHDLLSRILLPRLSLGATIAEVMTAPVHCLDVAATAQDAMLLMSRHGLRHVPVVEQGRLVNVVSERDLFAMQRLSLKQVSGAIRSAADVPALRAVALDIRRFARNLLGQGVAARQLSELISHLNDLVAQRVLQLLAPRHGVDMGRACWLAFGSEGRSEQTIATDQDNGLIFDSDVPDRDRPQWLTFGREVNEVLDACGYPLCKGGIMAGNPACCLSVAEWCTRFNDWLEHGAPEDLLSASIFFDLRPLAGNTALAAPLQQLVLTHAPRLPRFMKQMADNALRQRAPLSWLGGIETATDEGHEWLDLKLQGTALFVDVARLYALAHGVPQAGTRARLEAMGRALQVPAHEHEAWVAAFEFLQWLRLRLQMDAAGSDADQPNRLDLATLNDIDRRMLKESLRVARRLQQRLELDYQR
ncbi:MAG: CBS domain-containing protein [Burkholderiaceae bacterium]|nr:CBS domain-containing protein [Burkholderiaceae bacterium]